MIISNSLSDGVDMDFSNITINNLKIENSLNDCIDFSYGKYFINKAIIKNCGDKGVSVGENSTLKINDIQVEDSNLGIVSKDSSKIKVDNASVISVDKCFVAYKKKQEFNGGLIEINNGTCQNYSEIQNTDIYSKIIIKK
jgi:hypothetical protein